MTLIAVVGDMMLSDSGVFRGETVGRLPAGQRKIVRAPDGSLIGACGNSPDIDMLHAWVAAGMNFDKHPDLTVSDDNSDNGLDWLWLKPDRALIRCMATWKPYAIASPANVGVMTACLLFDGALAAGATPIRAMEIAIERCVYVGGDVDFERLKPAEPALRNGSWKCPYCQAVNREMHDLCLSCCQPHP